MTFQRFTGDNAALLLIDHQVGTMGWVTSATFDEMKRNALILAKAARILKLPTVLTSSMEEAAQGPLLGELETILPAEFAARIKRLGIVNGGRTSSRVTCRHFDHSNASRAFISRSNRPYGLTCSQISGVRAP